MNENKSKRKEWVKSAAIVFLSVMLVLTFFSQTIMNYSLPEVAVQYIESGSITTQIRGTGTVKSGDPYKVKVKGVRKVESIEVRAGDIVKKGDILMYLSSEDSAELEAAKAELENAERVFELAMLTGDMDISVMQNAGKVQSMETYKKNIMALKNAIAAAEKEVESAQKDVDEIQAWGTALSTEISITPSNTADTTEEQQAVDTAKAVLDNAEFAKTAAANELEAINRQILLQQTISGGDAAALEQQRIAANQKLIEAQNAYDKATLEYSKAQQALSAKIASGDTTGIIANLQNQQRKNNLNLYHAQNVLTEKQNALLEKQTMLSDYIKNATDAIGLAEKYQAITDAKKKVDELTQEMSASEVVAPISGTISEMYVQSGLDTPGDGVVLTMQPEGEGYTMSLSVTNDQARTVSVGMKADPVNSWRYDDLVITLTKMMPDTTDPSRKRMLVFEITGDSVVDGQSLSIAVGEKSSNYDMIVPNSAIREDNNGKFILIVEARRSPLGNRYIATRVDVEVIASDDTKSAITGGTYAYEYVITTATKPVEAGQQVRLSEN